MDMREGCEGGSEAASRIEALIKIISPEKSVHKNIAHQEILL